MRLAGSTEPGRGAGDRTGQSLRRSPARIAATYEIVSRRVRSARRGRCIVSRGDRTGRTGSAVASGGAGTAVGVDESDEGERGGIVSRSRALSAGAVAEEVRTPAGRAGVAAGRGTVFEADSALQATPTAILKPTTSCRAAAPPRR